MVEITQNKEILCPLFAQLPDKLISTFCDGYGGRGFADDAWNPQAGMIAVGDFVFLAGDSSLPAAHTLASHMPDGAGRPVTLFIVENDGWAAVLKETFGNAVQKHTRYATRKDADRFDHEKLSALSDTLPQGYTYAPIDERLYQRCLELDFARDFVSVYRDYDDWRAHGLGWCVLFKGDVVGGASSYASYNGGIEIEIAVAPAHRKKGLARAVGAKLVLQCLEKGLYPSWDAANPTSLHLAETLGYIPAGEYTCYVVEREKPPCR